jgi:hypothetical protein
LNKILASLLLLVPFQSNADEWKYSGEIYLWGPKMIMTTPTGIEAELPFHQILDDLDLAAMGVFSAHNDQWSFTADLIYMDLEQKKQRAASFPNQVGTEKVGRVLMSSWIVTPTVGYAFYNSEKARVEFIGGGRYLDMDVGLNVLVDGTEVFNEFSSQKFVDAVIGLRSTVKLNEKWYMPIYADVGDGDSDGTWQVLAGIGYRSGNWNTALAYRYLDYRFDDIKALSGLVVKGPQLNFGYTW